MSNTRYAAEGEPLNHERFCSAPEYCRGIVATMVGKKCSVVEDPRVVALLWFLQQRSLQLGGLRKTAKEIIERSRKHAASREGSTSQLDEDLERACIDPKFGLADIRALTHPLETLLDYHDHCVEHARRSIAFTSIARRVFALLDFAFETRSMVLAEGDSRLGKSRTAKAWCEMHPGVVRYVEVPASNDDRTFYATIAESLGVARGPSYNGQQINLRVIEVLKESRLMLVLDEAQFLWPQYNRPNGTPSRTLWR